MWRVAARGGRQLERALKITRTRKLLCFRAFISLPARRAHIRLFAGADPAGIARIITRAAARSFTSGGFPRYIFCSIGEYTFRQANHVKGVTHAV